MQSCWSFESLGEDWAVQNHLGCDSLGPLKMSTYDRRLYSNCSCRDQETLISSWDYCVMDSLGPSNTKINSNIPSTYSNTYSNIPTNKNSQRQKPDTAPNPMQIRHAWHGHTHAHVGPCTERATEPYVP